MAGGGRTSTIVPNLNDALAKPYELSFPLSAGQVANIDEMLRILFNSMREREAEIEAIEEDIDDIEEDIDDIPAADSSITVASLTLSAAQLGNLFVTPLPIIPAVPEKIIIPFHFSMQQMLGGTAFSAAPSVAPYWVTGSGALVGAIAVTNSINTSYTKLEIPNAITGTVDESYMNTAVELRGAATRTAGSGTFTYSVAYYLIDGEY